MMPTDIKIKPYRSSSIPVLGICRSAVTYCDTSVPVEWHVISGSCEPVLSGSKCTQLGIIQLNKREEVYQPVSMINKENDPEFQLKLQALLWKYTSVLIVVLG